jgi:hypothetical protein
MANYNEQLIRAWDEWEEWTGNEANDPDDFIDWAIENRRLHTPLEDVRKIHRRRVSEALRQVQRVNAEGTVYRGKQCVTVVDEDDEGNQRQRTLVFDVDKNGTPQLRQKAARQQRDRIANDVFRAASDVSHMNLAYPGDPRIQFELDFTEDYEERRAFEKAKRDKKAA